MKMRWLNFPFQPNINAETTLGHQHWTNVTLSTLFQRCSVNLETTSVNIHRLKFHFQPNFNGETTLVHRRSIDVILSTLLPRCFANVETTSMNGDDQHCFNVDSTLMCLLGELLIKKALVKRWDHFRFYGKFSPASYTKLIKRRKNLSLQSTFPIKLYQPEEDPTLGQISDKDVQCFLCLVVSTLNSETEIN